MGLHAHLHNIFALFIFFSHIFVTCYFYHMAKKCYLFGTVPILIECQFTFVYLYIIPPSCTWFITFVFSFMAVHALCFHTLYISCFSRVHYVLFTHVFLSFGQVYPNMPKPDRLCTLYSYRFFFKVPGMYFCVRKASVGFSFATFDILTFWCFNYLFSQSSCYTCKNA